jgi:hypothetical protein
MPAGVVVPLDIVTNELVPEVLSTKLITTIFDL